MAWNKKWVSQAWDFTPIFLELLKTPTDITGFRGPPEVPTWSGTTKKRISLLDPRKIPDEFLDSVDFMDYNKSIHQYKKSRIDFTNITITYTATMFYTPLFWWHQKTSSSILTPLIFRKSIKLNRLAWKTSDFGLFFSLFFVVIQGCGLIQQLLHEKNLLPFFGRVSQGWCWWYYHRLVKSCLIIAILKSWGFLRVTKDGSKWTVFFCDIWTYRFWGTIFFPMLNTFARKPTSLSFGWAKNTDETFGYQKPGLQNGLP